MSIIDKLKQVTGWDNPYDKGYQYDQDEDEGYGYGYEQPVASYEEPAVDPEEEAVEPEVNTETFARHHVGRGRSAAHSTEGSRVVDIHSGDRSQVVLMKLDKFANVVPVADVLNEKKIVVLNLETCSQEDSRRTLDFLYGVAYANNGEIKRVAGRAYIITPFNVPVSGDDLDGANGANE